MPSPAPVPFSQLKPYTYYIAPAPSDEARFLAGRKESEFESLTDQRALLVKFVGRRLHLMDKFPNGSWKGQLMQDDGNVKSVSFDETAFPPGQLFQEIPWNWKPAAPLPPLLPDPWDEFVHHRDMDITEAEHEAYEKKNASLKLKDVLSQADIVAQNQFKSTLQPAEKRALNAYTGQSYSFMGPLIIGDAYNAQGVVQYAKDETLANSTDPARPPLPKERPGPGFIREFMTGFLSVISRAPKLTQEINVFRGINTKDGLNINGRMTMSTSYDKSVALEFVSGLGGCCMLKINVKPGVRIFAIGGVEREIMILPPYNAKIEDVEHTNGKIKQVTITPVKYRGGTRRRRNRRRRRLRQTKKLTSKF